MEVCVLGFMIEAVFTQQSLQLVPNFLLIGVKGSCVDLVNPQSKVAAQDRQICMCERPLSGVEFWSPSLTTKFSEGLLHDPVKTQGT